MKLLDGKALAAKIRQETAAIVYVCEEKGIAPTLAIVTATNNESSNWYVNTIEKNAKLVGIQTKLSNMQANAAHDEIAQELSRLANDPSVHGIILQTPLPDGVDIEGLLSLIPFEKDVDGANPLSAGRLVCNLEAFAPATAMAVIAMLGAHHIELEGKHAVVIGRSRIVGKPVANLLLGLNATVTVCHSRTEHLYKISSQADVLVVAIGKASFITDKFVDNGACVIDVGTNVDSSGKLVGDIDAKSVARKAGTLSPVPGGVGPVTTAIILRHSALAAQAIALR